MFYILAQLNNTWELSANVIIRVSWIGWKPWQKYYRRLRGIIVARAELKILLIWCRIIESSSILQINIEKPNILLEQI